MPVPSLRLSRRSLVAGLLGLALGGCTGSPATTPTRGASGAGVGRPGGEGMGAALVRPGEWASERDSAVLELFGRLSAAGSAGDLRAWADRAGADEGPSWPGPVVSMAALGVDDVRLVAVREVVPPPPTAPGAQAGWAVRVALETRIGGIDASGRPAEVRVSLAATPADPRTVRVAAWEPVGRPQPWDLGPLEVRRAERVVVAVTDAAKDLVDPAELLRRSLDASAAVAEVWGGSAPAVVVAAPPGEAGRLLGRDRTGLHGVVAVTDGPLAPGRPAGADRVVVEASAWDGLTATGRDVVLRHELAHVAARRETYAAVPLWLSEGFADHVAYRDVPQGEREVAASLVRVVRSAGVPRHLPGDAEFAADGRDLSVPYAQGWLAVRVLVEAYGEHAVAEAYRRAAAGPPDDTRDGAARRTGAALRAVLGTSLPGLEAAWRQRLATLADPAADD